MSVQVDLMISAWFDIMETLYFVSYVYGELYVNESQLEITQFNEFSTLDLDWETV